MSFLESIFYMMWRGMAIGILISAPMGPVGILCIQRTLDKGRRTGFFTGIGAALSDLFYCLLTGFGLSFIEEFIDRNHNVIQLAGSAVLVAFAIYLFRKNPTRSLKTPAEIKNSDKKNILGGFLFTFSNPLILFLIIGLFARFNFAMPEIKFYHYMVGFIFIFAGALLWWWIVTYVIDKVRAHFNLRSMYLINRIIAIVILIFAIVGIVTSIINLTTPAASAQTITLNSAKGYGPLEEKYAVDNEGRLVIHNHTADTLTSLLACDLCGDFSLSLRVANLASSPTVKYSYSDPAGNTHKTSAPPWGIRLAYPHGTISFIFSPTETIDRSLTGRSAMKVETTLADQHGAYVYPSPDPVIFHDGIDPYSGTNSFLLSSSEGKITLYAGNRKYNEVCSAGIPESLGDTDISISFISAPASKTAVSDITATSDCDTRKLTGILFSEDELAAAFAEGADSPTGVWKILDRSMEEDQLRMGGEYTLAVFPWEQGYAIAYLDGARVLPEKWEMGKIKGVLTPSGWENVFSLLWIDAEEAVMDHDLKAQLEGEDILMLQFPYHNSTLRLHRVRHGN